MLYRADYAQLKIAPIKTEVIHFNGSTSDRRQV
jgi:hypothetical protein